MKAVILLLVIIACVQAKGQFYSWMGLEYTQENITQDLATIKMHAAQYSGLSFEKFGVGRNGELTIPSILTDIYPVVKQYINAGYPMISTYPHTKESMTYIRKLLTDPQPFIKAIIAEGIRNGYSGFNLDVEPTEGSDCRPGDDVAYANFINQFADACHGVGMTLGVDVASWCTIWNHTLMHDTRADYFWTMDTYSSTVTGFTNALNRLVGVYGADRLVVALPDSNWNANRPFTTEELKARFDLMNHHGITKISIWSMPFPDNWWPFIDSFINN